MLKAYNHGPRGPAFLFTVSNACSPRSLLHNFKFAQDAVGTCYEVAADVVGLKNVQQFASRRATPFCLLQPSLTLRNQLYFGEK